MDAAGLANLRKRIAVLKARSGGMEKGLTVAVTPGGGLWEPNYRLKAVCQKYAPDRMIITHIPCLLIRRLPLLARGAPLPSEAALSRSTEPLHKVAPAAQTRPAPPGRALPPRSVTDQRGFLHANPGFRFRAD
jgi:hypothetical protein